jgi:hypothetical protein
MREVATAISTNARNVPQRKPQGYMPNPPDLTLESALREHLSFLFSDWGAQIVQNETGAVVIESGGFCLKTIREREFFIFFIAPTAHPHGWENADIAIAAATGGAPLDVRTSLTNLAAALEPRVAVLQSAFAPEHISATERVMTRLREAAVERSRSRLSR